MPHAKINSKWISDSNITAEIKHLLQENGGGKSSSKTKVDKLDFITIKNFHASQDTIKKVKHSVHNERK